MKLFLEVDLISVKNASLKTRIKLIITCLKSVFYLPNQNEGKRWIRLGPPVVPEELDLRKSGAV